MKVRALIIVPKDEATDEFLASLPHNTQIEIMEPSDFEQVLAGFDQAAAAREAAMPPVESYEDYGPIDTEDGC